MCCEGEKIPYEYLIPPEKQDLVKKLGAFMSSQLGGPNNPMQGATPFPGVLSAPPDPSMLAAMNTMMGAGGYGGYTPGPFPAGPLTGPGMPSMPWEYEDGKKKRKDDDPDKIDIPDTPPRKFNFDPRR